MGPGAMKKLRFSYLASAVSLVAAASMERQANSRTRVYEHHQSYTAAPTYTWDGAGCI